MKFARKTQPEQNQAERKVKEREVMKETEGKRKIKGLYLNKSADQ